MVDRNEPCPCGSGKKYKSCHMGKLSSVAPAMLSASYMNRVQVLLEAEKDRCVTMLRETVDFYKVQRCFLKFPGHGKLLEEANRAIDKLDRQQIQVKPNYDQVQEYERVVGSILGDFTYIWVVPVLERLAVERSLKPEKFKTKDLTPFIDESVLVKSKLEMADSYTDPVLIIEFQSIKIEKWAVDGNHRIAARYGKDKESEVEGYCFPDELHVKAFKYDYMYVAYAIRVNFIKAYEYRRWKRKPKFLSMELL